MYKIGEFSQLGQVSVRTLRHYDQLGLLKPAHIDRFTDYRYYTIEQLPRLNRILALKDLGFSLEHIAGLLGDNLPADQLRGMLKLRQADLARELEAGQLRLARVEARLRQIEREGRVSPYEVLLKDVGPLAVAAARQRVPTLDDMPRVRCALYEELYAWLDRNRVEAGRPELAIYHNPEFVDTNIDMEAAVVVGEAALDSDAGPSGARVALRELPAVPTMASVVHHGDMFDVPDALIALYVWLGPNGYSAAGPYRELHLFGRENDWHDYHSVVIEMQLPVERR